MFNPIIAELRRGGVVESRHRGAYAVVDAQGSVIAKAGTFVEAFFPRSAIKAFQCLPLIESGAAKAFNLNDEEIALCCASHGGEAEHVRVARSVLAKAGIAETCYECGAHFPTTREAANVLIRAGQKPLSVHNNCSGKHAGMLALARHLGADLEGYVEPDHPVQIAVADCLTRYTGVDVAKAPRGIDGCSVPTWALPMDKIALAFAKLCDPSNTAAQWIIRAARAHPFLIAGTGRFDTKIMQAVPRLFIKVGAEGVFCGCIPHAGLGFALKCDDGAVRGAEVAVAEMLAHLDVWTETERAELDTFAREPLHNWRKLYVGEINAVVLN
jgi:L-asparaginase II